MAKKIRFYKCTVEENLRRDHFMRGGAGLSKYGAKLHDGELRVMAGEEPVGQDGALLLHVSVSVGKPGIIAPYRRPTDMEMRHVAALFSNKNLQEEEMGRDPKCRHLWEVVE